MLAINFGYAQIRAGLGMFGLGETLWAPLASAIVNDLAHNWVACTLGGTAVAAAFFLSLRRHPRRPQHGLDPQVVLAA